MHSPPSPSSPPRAGTTPTRIGAPCAVAFLVLLVLVAARWSALITLDRAVADSLHRRAVSDPGAVHAARILTDWVWDPWTMRLLIAVVVVALWWRGARLLAVWIAATSLLGSLLQQGLKTAVGRERPEWPDPVDSAQYAAFPSGHAMTAAVSCGLLLWVLRRSGPGKGDGARRWMWRAALTGAGASVVGVGLTRLYLGVHWLSDVVAGWLLGAAVVVCSVSAFARYGRRAALSRTR